MDSTDESEPLIVERSATIKRRGTYGSDTTDMGGDEDSKLVMLLREEYACSRKDTLIRLGRRGNDLVGIFLRPDEKNETKLLNDVKDKILEILANGEVFTGEVDPLHLIVSLHSPGQLAILELLCTVRSSNVLDSKLLTPLHHALSWHNLEYHATKGPEEPQTLVDIVTCLLENSADANARDFEGCTPLHYLLYSDDSGCISQLATILDLLIKAGADPNCPEPVESISPLGLACRSNGPFFLDAIKLLVSTDNVNDRDEFGRTALFHVFRSFGSDDIIVDKVRLLLEQGAIVDARDSAGRTPLLHALSFPEETWVLPVAKVLLANGANPKVKDNFSGKTPLHYACSYFRGTKLQELVQLLVDAGGDLNEPDNTLSTPFLDYCQNPLITSELLKFFVAIGADLAMVDQFGNGPIHMLCLCDEHQPIKSLVELGCDINAKNVDGFTPLLLGLEKYCGVQTVRTLVELGADCSVNHIQFGSPLHFVAYWLLYRRDVWDIVDVLVSGRADINCQDSKGNSPLHTAVQYRVREYVSSAVKSFIRLGADVNLQNALGDTPLHDACRLTDLPVQLAEILLARGALVNQTNAKGETPLHAAQTSPARSSLTKLLVRHESDLWAKDDCNATPLDRMSSKFTNYVIRYAALLAANGKSRLGVITSEQFNQYLSTARAMKTLTLGDSSVTLSQFLLSSNFIAARHVEKPKALSDLQAAAKDPKYSLYSSYIKNKLLEVMRSKEMFKLTIDSLKLITSPFQFSEPIIDRILSKLSARDMNSLNRAVHHLNV